MQHNVYANKHVALSVIKLSDVGVVQTTGLTLPHSMSVAIAACLVLSHASLP